MPSKPAIRHDPPSALPGSTLQKLILERDEVYNDQCQTHRVLEHLSYVNKHDSNTEEDAVSYFESPSNKQVKNPPYFIPISSFLDLGKDSSETPIYSEDLSHYYSQIAEDTERTQTGSLRIDFQDSGGLTKNEDVLFEDVLEGSNVQKGTSEDPPADLGRAGESQSHQLSPDSSRLSREEKAYNKNLVCYIAKAVRRIIFGKCRESIAKRCQKHGISYQQFTSICNQRKFSGVNALISFFTGNCEAHQQNVRNIFKDLFQKILRRAYLLTAIGEGKMFKLNNYAEFKNKYLLYLDHIQKE